MANIEEEKVENQTKKEKKSKLSPKAQKIVDTISTVVEFILIAICIVVSIFVIASPSYVSDNLNTNVSQMVVFTNSMEGTFSTSDLIFGKSRTEADTDETHDDIGKIITFLTPYNGTYVPNSHRIIGYVMDYTIVEENGDQTYHQMGYQDVLDLLYGTEVTKASDYDYKNSIYTSYSDVLNYLTTEKHWTKVHCYGYITKGDNNTIYPEGTYHDDGYVKFADIKGEVVMNKDGSVKKVAVVGGVIKWLRFDDGASLHFALVIMIPLGLLFAYNVYIVIKYIIEQKEKKVRETVLAEQAKAQPTIDEEEIKRKAIEEYLAKQLENQKKQDEDSKNE